jgi:NAD(P)-dependent dehydrogenase (short-subunit alcohol dehydrogenase family)
MAEKVVVITGASSGIGAELAKVLGARGHAMVLAARREPELRRSAQEAGPRAIVVVADVTRRAEVERLRDEALAAFGRVDVWVNNAGRGIVRDVLDLTDDDVDAMISVNLKSALYGMQAILPHFKERGEGQVINVSTFIARAPLASVRSIYAGAKAALDLLSANLRVDLHLSHPGIHVSVVIPGLVDTEFAKSALGAVAPEGPPPGPSSGPFRSQTVREVADAIASLLLDPVAELYTNPAHPALARRYLEDPAEFEAEIAEDRLGTDP